MGYKFSEFYGIGISDSQVRQRKGEIDRIAEESTTQMMKRDLSANVGANKLMIDMETNVKVPGSNQAFSPDSKMQETVNTTHEEES